MTDPTEHSPEDVESMEHYERQQIAGQYGVDANLSGDELLTELKNAVREPTPGVASQYSREDIESMEYYDWQALAPDLGVEPNQSPNELEEQLLDAVESSESSDDENDEAQPEAQDEPVEDARESDDDEKEPVETEQAELVAWERDEPENEIDYESLRFEPETDDEEIDTRVDIDIADYYDDSPTEDARQGSDETDGEGNGVARVARKLRVEGETRHLRKECITCASPATIHYGDEKALCEGCNTIYPIDSLAPNRDNNDDEQEPVEHQGGIESECPSCEGRVTCAGARAVCRECQSIFRVDRESDDELTLADAFSA
ncbi:hypothetical protein [Natrialbaceae archaeon AArc-T1-2]|uniref:hypothetical protein n=1 Tax=Natrialbaceae archaeon AArc-T1-2 TaxID=3053904 RepID=UPI00255AB4DF|nr:hypothetical protein [Natrialbaceae archaeon AArc-T1-2]WIV66555.1 hypothetical protein QQ977_12760 [Natrialbaceae archaeon AArc-T1-2]